MGKSDLGTVVETGATAVSDILEHHGVKGQKWGVRKDRGHEGERAKTKVIAKLDRKYEKQAEPFSPLYNKGAARINSSIDKFNSNPRWQKAANSGELMKTSSSEYKAYHEAVSQHVEKIMNDTAKEYGVNASGTKQIKYAFDDQTMAFPMAYLADVKHAADDIVVPVVVTKDSKGLITSISINPKSLGHADDVVDSILEHHGIKGQRWGVRRRRGANGELVPVTTQTNRSGQITKTSGGQNHPTHEDARRALTSRQVAASSGTHALSTQELRTLVNRMNLEQQYAQLSSSKSSRAKIRNGTSAARDILAVGNTINEAHKFATSPAGKAVASALKSR